MRRCALTLLLFSLSIATAEANVWMVKSSGAVGCDTQAKLIEHEGHAAPPLPDGCVALFAGERLIDVPEVGVGFNSYLRVQRSDRSIIFVASSAIAADPGIGSVSEDRPE